MSKPCSHCQKLIGAFNIKNVFYSTPLGLEKL
jgi:deoxycytidylate deaminase